MKSFLQHHQADIYGVLSGFDRLRFRGTFRAISFVQGVMNWLWLLRILLKQFGRFADRQSQRLRRSTEELAKTTPVGKVVYLSSSTRSKPEELQELIRKHNIPDDYTGILAIFSCVEPCWSYEVGKNAEQKKLLLLPAFRKCLHYYLYVRHPQYGLLHLRIQTWLPFRVQVCLNGREWLARQLDAAGIAYTRVDNTFPWVADFEAAQGLLDQQRRTNWPRMLSALVRETHRGYGKLMAELKLPEPYWSAEQTEWATDVAFRSKTALQALYPRLLRHAILCLGCADTMRFLQQKVTAQGAIHDRFTGEVVTSLARRVEGVRVKHAVGQNSVKMYDKFALVLRIETTIHNAEGLKVYRPKEGDPGKKKAWRALRRGVADLHRRCALSQKANQAYLEALAVVEAPEPLGEVAKPLSRRVHRSGRRYRGLNLLSADDSQVLSLLNRGEYALVGFRNREVREGLYGPVPKDKRKRKQQSARVTRWFMLMRAHGLIERVPKSHRYKMTAKGRRAASAIRAAQEANIKELGQAA